MSTYYVPKYCSTPSEWKDIGRYCSTPSERKDIGRYASVLWKESNIKLGKRHSSVSKMAWRWKED